MEPLYFTGAEYAEFSINNPEDFNYMADFSDDAAGAVAAGSNLFGRLRDRLANTGAYIGQRSGALGEALSLGRLAGSSNAAKILGIASLVPLGYGVYAGVRGGIRGIGSLINRNKQMEQPPRRKFLGVI